MTAVLLGSIHLFVVVEKDISIYLYLNSAKTLQCLHLSS